VHPTIQSYSLSCWGHHKRNHKWIIGN
jgi:hypothetical protein